MQLRDYQKAVIEAAFNFIKYTPEKHGYVKSPGGSGKSIMIAKLAERCFDDGKIIIILTRSEKLLRQNKSKLGEKYQAQTGIYCGGLNEYEIEKDITIATIQSIVNAEYNYIPKNLVVIIDEFHEVPTNEDSQYRKFLERLGDPQIIGFTATDFRTNEGQIEWAEKIIDIPIKPLIESGYLVAPRNKIAFTPDLSNIEIKMGEYVESQLEELFADPELLKITVAKIQQYSADRNSCIIFCQSIMHAQVLAETMTLNGMESKVVTGKTDKQILNSILDDFEARKFKYLLNCNMLTTGYDLPCIDMVVVARATISKGLFEQMVYRIVRKYNPLDDKYKEYIDKRAENMQS